MLVFFKEKIKTNQAKINNGSITLHLFFSETQFFFKYIT